MTRKAILQPDGRSGAFGLLSRGFPAVPNALKQPTLALSVFPCGVPGVDLSGLAIYDFVRPVCLSNGVGQAGSVLRFGRRKR